LHGPGETLLQFIEEARAPAAGSQHEETVEGVLFGQADRVEGQGMLEKGAPVREEPAREIELPWVGRLQARDRSAGRGGEAAQRVGPRLPQGELGAAEPLGRTTSGPDGFGAVSVGEAESSRCSRGPARG